MSHALPAAAEITLDLNGLELRWGKVPGAAGYSLELEREEGDDDVIKMVVDLPSTITSWSIPKALQGAGDYQVGVAVKGKNGNLTVVEKEFSIPK